MVLELIPIKYLGSQLSWQIHKFQITKLCIQVEGVESDYSIALRLSIVIQMCLIVIQTHKSKQWWIQDFPDWGAPTYYLAKFSPKTAWKWKKLNRERGTHP